MSVWNPLLKGSGKIEHMLDELVVVCRRHGCVIGSREDMPGVILVAKFTEATEPIVMAAIRQVTPNSVDWTPIEKLKPGRITIQ